MRQALTFGDVLIQPQYSDIVSRDEIEVKSFYLGRDRLPIMSSPMDYVTGFEMAQAMSDNDAYGVVSRFGDVGEPREGFHNYALAIGIKDIDKSLAKISTLMPDAVCIDVAHGHHKNVEDTITAVREVFPYLPIIAGNVATGVAFDDLAYWGADAIRVGIGPGSVCSTRENTGVGVPQLSAILDCADAHESYPEVALIADGGIQTPGDIAKALSAGADAVMLGRMLAGHDETPGEIVSIGLDNYKLYRGQSMLGTNGYRGAPEGIEGLVSYQGPVKDTLERLMNYLRSSMSYVGARNLREFRERALFIEVSQATFQESNTRI